MKSINSTLAIAGLVAGLLLAHTGCAESEPVVLADDTLVETAVPDGMMRGTVLETLNSGGYTYVFIETDQDKRWIAVRQIVIQVGDTVQVYPGSPMADFHSKSLNRTFEVVYFLEGLENLSAPAGHQGTESVTEVPATDITVVALKDHQNVAYVYANRDELAGQQISLRGQVVKYNSGILGWNFIHIQDGSGDVADGSNDLTVTSKFTTAVGDTVVVTGTIILNKDFGAGYSFPILMEGASITAE